MEARSQLWDTMDRRATSLARDRVLDAPAARSRGPWLAKGGFEIGEVAPGVPREAGFVGLRDAMNLERVFAGIEFMRYLDGEKHLVFVTDSNMVLSRIDYEEAIAALANDAGVTIDTVQTGGLIGPLVFSSLRNLATLTGGVASLFEYPQQGVERLNRVTSFKYVLGYHPSNPARDGRYRTLTIRVNRPGVSVSYRHGYYASDVLIPSDRRTFVVYRRIFAAGQYGASITDIGLVARPSYTVPQRAPDGRPGAAGDAVVSGTIDVTRVTFARAGDRRTASLDLAAFCTDAAETLLGEAWQKIDLNLTEETYRRAVKDGIPYSIRVPVTAAPRWSKVVVYDYRSDLLGSSAVRIR